MMRWTAARLALLLLPLLALAPPAGAVTADNQPVQKQWQLISNRDGIEVYRAHDDTARIKTFRGVTTIELHDFYAPIAVFDDEEGLPRWLYLIRDLNELQRRSPTDRDYHVLTNLPWPVTDRDAGLHFTLGQNPQTRAIQILFRTKNDLVPIQDDYVRIPEMTGHLNVLPLAGKNVQITFEVLVDPGGYIPAFLVNFILKDLPFVSLQRLRRIINTDRFQGYRVDYITAPAAWVDTTSAPKPGKTAPAILQKQTP